MRIAAADLDRNPRRDIADITNSADGGGIDIGAFKYQGTSGTDRIITDYTCPVHALSAIGQVNDTSKGTGLLLSFTDWHLWMTPTSPTLATGSLTGPISLGRHSLSDLPHLAREIVEKTTYRE